MVDIPLRPGGVRFYGIFGLPYNDTGGATLTYENWDFETSFKNQIDACKAVGANTFIWFGDVHWFSRGNIDLDTYLSRRRQVHQYLYDIGMYSLCYEAASWVYWNANVEVPTADTGEPSQPSWTDAISIIATASAQAAQFRNTIGIIGIDEPFSGVESDHAGLLGHLSDLYDAIKAVVPIDVPVCCAPNPCGNSAFPVWNYTDGTAVMNADAGAPVCDFWAFHPFAAVSLSDSAAIRAAYPGKEIVMPSSCLSTNTDNDIVSKMDSIFGLVGANNFRLAGYFLSLDIPGDSHTYGMFNSDYTLRTTKTNAFAANIDGIFPQRQSRRFYGNNRLNEALRWDAL